MNKELEFWQFALAIIKKNEPVILMIVAESTGSSPGRQGFKMFVTKDGLAGSIGGGVMEVSLVEKAKSLLQNSKIKIQTEIIEQVHRKDSPNSSGMICSGKQSVLVKVLTEIDLKVVERIIGHLKEIKNTLFLQVTESSFQTIEVENFTINIYDYFFKKKQKNKFIYHEKLGFTNNLFIIGGGHCALALSEIMSKLDFHISLFDDRPNLNTLNKNQFVHSKTIIESYEKIKELIPSGENNYVVVMTLGYKFDEIVIRQLLVNKYKYFGVLGSKAKMKILLKSLEKEGFNKHKLRKIHTPIGLLIKSRTPEEIAISIAAEIISVKNTTN